MLDRLRDTLQAAEGRALSGLKRRLEGLEEQGEDALPAPTEPAAQVAPVQRRAPAILAELLQQTHSVDVDAAMDASYCRTLARLVPDQVAMLEKLAECEVAPLCHLIAGRFPGGLGGFSVLSNISTLGDQAGILVPEQAPHYMTGLLTLGLLLPIPREESLATEYELLQANTQLREMQTHIRDTLKMYPHLQQYAVRLSDYGQALWRDCRPLAEELLDQ